MAIAGALTDQTHETAIMDLGTTASMAEVYTTKLRVAAEDAVRNLGPASSQLGRIRARLQVRLLDRLLSEALTRLCNRRADAIAECRCDFVVVDIGHERAWGMAQCLLTSVRRRRPALPLFACGPFAEVFHDSVLERCPALDGVLMPDAELAVMELAARVHAGDQWRFVPNFRHRRQAPDSFHREFVQDLDTLPAPACGADIYPSLDHTQKLLLMPVDDARGAMFPLMRESRNARRHCVYARPGPLYAACRIRRVRPNRSHSIFRIRRRRRRWFEAWRPDWWRGVWKRYTVA